MAWSVQIFCCIIPPFPLETYTTMIKDRGEVLVKGKLENLCIFSRKVSPATITSLHALLPLILHPPQLFAALRGEVLHFQQMGKLFT
jgi:hypothetical protein